MIEFLRGLFYNNFLQHLVLETFLDQKLKVKQLSVLVKQREIYFLI